MNVANGENFTLLPSDAIDLAAIQERFSQLFRRLLRVKGREREREKSFLVATVKFSGNSNNNSR